MSVAKHILFDFDHEMATTRTLLERVPDDAASWKPHPKSTSLGGLAVHIASLARWTESVARLPEIDFAGPSAAELRPAPFESTRQVLDMFDKGIAAGRAAIADSSDGAMKETWVLRAGPRVIVELPRAGALGTFVIHHIIHHRGQLSVYLRLRDVALPSIYGPTADM